MNLLKSITSENKKKTRKQEQNNKKKEKKHFFIISHLQYQHHITYYSYLYLI